MERCTTMVKLVAACGVVAVVCGGLSSSAMASYPGTKNGLIAYVNQGVRTMHADGSGKTLLDRYGTDPIWSPDGKRIAYVRTGDIWIMNADGTNKLRVTTAASQEFSPTWSPDGSKIAFVSYRNPAGTVYQLNSTKPFGSPVAIYTEGVDYEPVYQALWSSTGTMAVVRATESSSDGGCCQIDLVTGATTLKHLTFCINCAADWGPKGLSIAFMNGREDPNDPYSVIRREIDWLNVGTGASHELAVPNYIFDNNPAWAPTGGSLLYDEYLSNYSTGQTTASCSA